MATDDRIRWLASILALTKNSETRSEYVPTKNSKACAIMNTLKFWLEETSAINIKIKA
jgi:hypothetical protein